MGKTKLKSTTKTAERNGITGARTRLPATALPLTYDVLGGKEVQEQISVSGSVVDAVFARVPAFSPTREQPDRRDERYLFRGTRADGHARRRQQALSAA